MQGKRILGTFMNSTYTGKRYVDYVTQNRDTKHRTKCGYGGREIHLKLDKDPNFEIQGAWGNPEMGGEGGIFFIRIFFYKNFFL